MGIPHVRAQQVDSPWQVFAPARTPLAPALLAPALLAPALLALVLVVLWRASARHRPAALA